MERTYVYFGCPYIKVDVRFRLVNDASDLPKEDPEDVIESISRPYLQWSIMDQAEQHRTQCATRPRSRMKVLPGTRESNIFFRT